MVEPVARGPLRIVSNADLTRAETSTAAQEASRLNAEPDTLSQLSAFIRQQWYIARNHRASGNEGWDERLLKAMRVFNGVYDADKLAQIQQFGGSTVYARLVSVKCRGATSLLRDVYLGHERPYAITPTSDPEISDDGMTAIGQMVTAELQNAQQGAAQGLPVPTQSDIDERVRKLHQQLKDATKVRARDAAENVEDDIDALLVEGGFYDALAEVLVDLPLFPFAVLKGPTVRMVPDVKWVKGKAKVQMTAKMFWNRVSPFDIWWTPGASKIDQAAIFERTRLTRADLNDVLGLPGYDEQAVRAVLQDYGRGGLVDWMDYTDAERAVQESRENPTLNRSGMIDCLVYNGPVQGSMLLQFGFSEKDIPDEDRDYMVQAWQIGRHTIKCQLSPSPRKRHPYYITSFEKVPGTIVGNGLPDILEDVQDVANATLRSLVNNLSISSGPQVVVNTDRMAPSADPGSLFPWKRWYVVDNPMQANSAADPPVSFFQPQSNAQELLAVYTAFSQMADELSAIPRFLTGTSTLGGAGRTASGLAMLMGNAGKILQTVAANIDRDIMEPSLTGLFDMLMLTSTDPLLKGDEHVEIKGVAVAVQRETERQRQLEFLQATANPIDSQIIQPDGRATLLREVAKGLGLPGADIVPSDDAIKALMAAKQAAAQQAQQSPMMGHNGGPPMNEPPGADGAKAQGHQPGKSTAHGPMTNTVSANPPPTPPLGHGIPAGAPHG